MFEEKKIKQLYYSEKNSEEYNFGSHLVISTLLLFLMMSLAFSSINIIQLGLGISYKDIVISNGIIFVVCWLAYKANDYLYHNKGITLK
jgi:hypothetical protein